MFMKKEKNNKSFKQSKKILWCFAFLGVLITLAFVSAISVKKGTYSAGTNGCYCEPAISSSESSCKAAGGTWKCNGNVTNCPLGTYTSCSTGWYCTYAGGCFTLVGKIGNSCTTSSGEEGTWTENGCVASKKYIYFYTWDGSTLITSCELTAAGEIKGTCNYNAIGSGCSGFSTHPYSNTNSFDDGGTFKNGDVFYCAADYSRHNCCYDANGALVDDSFQDKNSCENGGYTWYCGEEPSPSTKPTPSSSSTPAPSSSSTPAPSSSSTPAPSSSSTPTPSSSSTPTPSSSSTPAPSSSSATTSTSSVKPAQSCYECTVNGKKKTVFAYSESEAAKKIGGKNCSAVSSNKCNVIVNPPTSTIALVVAWFVGLLAIIYSFWYFKKNSLLK